MSEAEGAEERGDVGEFGEGSEKRKDEGGGEQGWFITPPCESKHSFCRDGLAGLKLEVEELRATLSFCEGDDGEVGKLEAAGEVEGLEVGAVGGEHGD